MTLTEHVYRQRLEAIQRKMTLLQQAYARSGGKAVIVFEGYDASGKGGIIRRLVWALDPRPLRVHSIAAPDDAERRQHWMKRFWKRVPDAGRWAVLDRSWYGRVLVERIEGLAADVEWRRAYDEINAFERTLTEEGTRLVKILLDITPETQLHRFQGRYEDPTKRWKLTVDDIRNRDRFEDYRIAFAQMVRLTDHPHAPWVRVDANHKRSARLAALEAIHDHLAVGVDLALPPLKPEIEAFFADRDA